MANIVGVALNQAGKFLGFVDRKGKIRKGRVRKLRRNPSGMKTYQLVWSPTGQIIATVQAKTMKAAKRKAPKPYSKYKGEIYAREA